MSRNPFTILFLTDRASRIHRFGLSRPVVGALSVGLVLVALAALAAPALLLRERRLAEGMARLRAEKGVLEAEASRRLEELDRLAARLGRVEARAGRLAEALGLSPAVPPAAGGAAADPAATELESLDLRAGALDESLEQLDDAFRQRMALLASTPATMPVEGWFSHGFGWREDPWTGTREFHRGIDIVADEGAEIRAPADGMVSHVARKPDYGKTLDISHGHGYLTRYAHLSEVLVRPGQRVHRGDRIGRVGSTGRSTGPHLHYEVFRDGRRVNPWKYLGQRGR